MLACCAGLIGRRTILSSFSKQEQFVQQRRNFRWDFWNTPFGYLLKPPKAISGSPEWHAHYRKLGWMLVPINIGLVVNIIFFRPDIKEALAGIKEDPLQKLFPLLQARWRHLSKEEVDEKNEQSEELLKLAEKANKPFEPITKLPDWPPPFINKDFVKQTFSPSTEAEKNSTGEK